MDTLASDQMRQKLGGGLLALFFAFAQFRLISLLFQEDYVRAVEAAYRVVIGMPHWRPFQSRILGPFMIQALGFLGPGYFNAHVCFSIVTLAIAGYLAWRLGWQIGGNRMAALFSIFVFEAAFVFMLTPHWLYAWDYLDAIVFLLFIEFVVKEFPWPWFAGLFAVAIFNRESAQFIALWMILDPLVRWFVGRHRGTATASLNRGMLTAGAACLAAGIAVVETMRSTLLIAETGYGTFPDVPTKMSHFSDVKINLVRNLAKLGQALTTFDYNMSFLIVLFFILVIWIAVRLAVLNPTRYLGLALVHCAILAAVLTFGIFEETRLYIGMIGIIVAGSVILSADDPKAQRRS